MLQNESEFFPNFGVGAYYYTDNFYVGFSVPKLLSYEIKNSQKKMNIGPDNYDFLLTGGVLLKMSNLVKLKPSFLVRYRLNNTFQVDGSLNLIFYDALWVGYSYRHKNQHVAMVEYQVNEQIRAGVAYDIPSGDLAGLQKGSLEVVLRYDFKYKMRAVSPRYF